MAKKYDEINIKGARVNNLKNINLKLPKYSLITMTGLSGSGKTSLAFDTIYAEGQRRYVESLSSYARQFLGGIEKPDVDQIDGLSPSIAIDQKTTSNNPRSTVGTITEIYDYLRLFYARCGVPHCPVHKTPINATTIDQIIKKIMLYKNESRLEILANVFSNKKGTFKDYFEKVRKMGYVRVYVDSILYDLDDEITLDKNIRHNIDVVVDRILKKDSIESRLFEAIENAIRLTDGTCVVKCDDKYELFSTNYSCIKCGFSFPKIEPRLFSFNSPLGACSHCKGIGYTQHVDLDYLMPDLSLSINQGGIKYYANQVDTLNIEWQTFKALCNYYAIDLDKPLNKLSKDDMDIILNGSKHQIKYTIISSSGRKTEKTDFIEGIKTLIERRNLETTSSWAKQYYESFLIETVCDVCSGARLQDTVLAIKINNLSIYDFTKMSIIEAYNYVSNIKLDETNIKISSMLIEEMKSRLKFLNDVGLDYITLDRIAGSLSGGEAQRIRLATQIGSALTGVLYVLDEPSIGLHQKDNDKLIETLKKMVNLGNTVIVVEHDTDTMLASDYLVDVGPGAGKNGGEIVACGTPDEVMASSKSLTGKYLSGKLKIDIPKNRRKGNGKYIELLGCKENNLKNINVKIPLKTFTCITGVSGSGKSTLINEILVKSILKNFNRLKEKVGNVKSVKGLEHIDKLVAIDQDPIGRTPRSNPATYTGVFDDIRDVFASSLDAKQKGFDKSRFSFNVKGGRCESCNGDGVKKISMLFVPDVYVECEVCRGKRYNLETLDVKYKDKTIYDVLKMSVEEALDFFKNHPKIKDKLDVLYNVGLGYIELGQSAPTLSGGEAQRVKLASELSKKQTGKTIYVLDEPTTGLHSHDVKKLISIFDSIVNNGDSVVVIEHNLDVIKCADYIIDLGPDGGVNGGEIVASGTPEEIAKKGIGYTSKYIRKVLKG